MQAQFFRVLIGVVLAGMLGVAPFATISLAQDAKSPLVAVELAKLMESRKLDSVAARLPQGQDEFVAALYFPGQLLVVWAKYSAPALLNEKIAKGDFRDVYIDLNSASIAASKTLITDLGADGLKARREENQPFDAQDIAGKSFQFDGSWREDKISEEEYMKAYASADDAYAKALSVLLAQLKKG